MDRARSDGDSPVAVGLYFEVFFRKFACGLGFAGRGDAEKTNKKTRQKQPQHEQKRE